MGLADDVGIISSPELNVEIKTMEEMQKSPDFTQIYFTDGCSALVKNESSILKGLKQDSKILIIMQGTRYKMFYGPIEEDKLHIYP